MDCFCLFSFHLSSSHFIFIIRSLAPISYQTIYNDGNARCQMQSLHTVTWRKFYCIDASNLLLMLFQLPLYVFVAFAKMLARTRSILYLYIRFYDRGVYRIKTPIHYMQKAHTERRNQIVYLEQYHVWLIMWFLLFNKKREKTQMPTFTAAQSHMTTT